MTKKAAWSFSALNSFETCPHRHYRTRVLKDVRDDQSEALLWGNEVHKALELRIKDDKPLPTTMEKWEPIVAKLLARKGESIAEQKLCLNENLSPTSWFAKDAWCRGVVDYMLVDGKKAVALDWKGLAVDTPLPTPSGWTTMGHVQVGDQLFSESGDVCTVLGKSEVKNIQCYEVTFDDTTKVTCDEQHLWKLVDGSVVPVTELQAGSKIAVPAPLGTETVELPIDPYVLGLWIADGKHSSGEISKPDTFVWEEICKRGYDVNMATGGSKSCPTRTVKGLRTQLIKAGLLKNKHIPSVYLRAGYTQRVDLLRGLMDGDGNANPHRKQAIYTTIDAALAGQVRELLLSLGQRPLINDVVSKGFGRTCRNFPVSFRPIGLNPFLLPRKRDRVKDWWGSGNSWRRKVTSVDKVERVPTQCIKVDSADCTFLCGDAMIPTHNTGKPKDNHEQLMLFAALLLHHYPELEVIRTGYVWLAHGSKITSKEFTRADVPQIWEEFLPRVKRLQQAVDADKWPKKPSGLCRAWCPVLDCEFNGRS